MQNTSLRHTNLIVNEKKIVTLDGVENVEGFDQEFVSLKTVVGQITIEGDGLKIESLSKDNGEIRVSGNILGVYYSETKKNKNFFEKIFK